MKSCLRNSRGAGGLQNISHPTELSVLTWAYVGWAARRICVLNPFKARNAYWISNPTKYKTKSEKQPSPQWMCRQLDLKDIQRSASITSKEPSHSFHLLSDNFYTKDLPQGLQDFYISTCQLFSPWASTHSSTASLFPQCIIKNRL